MLVPGCMTAFKPARMVLITEWQMELLCGIDTKNGLFRLKFHKLPNPPTSESHGYLLEY